MSTGVMLALGAAGVIVVWVIGLLRIIRLAFRLLAVTLRFVEGRPLGRQPATNATFLRRADRVLSSTGRASSWAHLPGWERAAVRLGSLAVIALAGLAYFTGSGWLWAALSILIVSGLSVAAWRAWQRWRDWRHQQTFVRPLGRALAPTLGLSIRQASAAIRFPRNYADTAMGELGRIMLPDTFHPDQQRTLGLLVKSRLPVDADLSWRLSNRPIHLAVNASPKPPDRIPFADLRAEMDKCQPGDIVIGLDRRREVFRGSFRTEDPHWALSMGSGRGKSSFLQLVIAQILHQDPGATVTAVDPKMTSLDAMVGVPGFTVANDPRDVPGMWATIEGFAAEMERRMDTRQVDPTAEFPVALLVIDELNQFSAMSAAIWRTTKEKGDPATPPIWLTLAGILWQGRAFNCHVIAVGQRMDERATGGIGLRDSFGLRGLAGFTAQQWAMLVGTSPVPRSQKPRGRIIFWDGSEATWVQAGYGTPEELRAYALEGRRDMSGLTPDTAPQPAETAPSRTDTGTAWVVGLAAGADYVGLSPAAFEKRRQRVGGSLPGEVRQGNQPAWTATDLDAWRESWPRVVAGRTGSEG